MNTLLFWLLQNAIVVACFTPLVWLACRCLRSRPAEQHLLWTLLLVKLMLPPQLTGALPLDRLTAWWPIPPTDARSGSVEQVPVATLEVAELVGMSPADSGQELVLMPLPVEYGLTELPPLADAPPVDAVPLGAMSPDARRDSVASLLADLRGRWAVAQPYVAGAWLVGCLIAAVLTARRVGQARRLVRSALPPTDELIAAVARIANQMHIQPPETRLVLGLPSPLVACRPRPLLLWPAERTSAAALTRSAPIIAHELAHVRRRDHLVAWLELAAGIVWWWNPLFWHILRQARETREMACDALALSGTTDARRDYAHLLLELTTGQSFAARPLPTFGAGPVSRASLQRRLVMLFNERATARVSVAGLAIAMLLAAMLLPGWILADDAPPAPADTDQTTPRAYLGILTDDSQPAPDSQTVVAPEVPGTPFAPPAPGKANTPTTQPLPATPQPPAPFDPPSTPAAAGLRISVPGMGPAPIALDLAFPVAHAPTDQSGAPGTAQAVETTAVQAVEAEGPDTELPAGDGHSTVRLKWLHNGLVRIEIVRDGQVVQQLHAAVPPATQNIPAAHPHVRHLRVAPLGDGRVLHFVPVEAAPGQPATRVAVVHAAPPVAAAPARVAMTLHGDQFTAAIPTADPQLQFECELAEITVEEKRIELEMATEQAAAQPSPDPTTRGKIKLLQLALRKAEIELARCRARMPQAQPLTPAAPTAVPAVPATPILPQPM